MGAASARAIPRSTGHFLDDEHFGFRDKIQPALQIVKWPISLQATLARSPRHEKDHYQHGGEEKDATTTNGAARWRKPARTMDWTSGRRQ